MFNVDLGVGCNSAPAGCTNNQCPRTPDFCIKRNDTRPSLRISISDCDGVVDLTDQNLVLEANMWFEAKLKTSINETDSSFSFADNIGFDQISVGDLIIVSRPRNPEQMLVTQINEESKTITVERAQGQTQASTWSRGTLLRIFKFINHSASIESVFEDVAQVDGTTTNELTDTFLVFNWEPEHTNLPGCYWLEFKLIMIENSSIEWVKRIPLSDQGYLISVIDSPTPNV